MTSVFIQALQLIAARALCSSLTAQLTLQVQYHQFSIFSSGICLSNIWGFLYTSRLKLDDCQPLIDKVRKRLSGWKSKLMSLAGRVELIKSILSSLHLFWTSSFKLPKACTDMLDRHLRNFFWGFFWRQYLGRESCKPTNQGRMVSHLF